ncbi:hypothetical protein DA100_10590 [Vibrio sp. Hep-1b-8]|nr:hypothetical protein DA100_10590 [Vibrio sp. Hep-1b-8]
MNAGAFIIQNNEGKYDKVVAFGDENYGGVINNQLSSLLSLIQPDQMYASGNAMLALSTNTNTAVTWGHGIILKGDEQTIANVEQVYPGSDSFIIVGTSSAQHYVQEYNPQSGLFTPIEGLSSADPVKAIYHTGGEIGQPIAWLAITHKGNIVTWGDPEAGGVMPHYAETALTGQIADEVYATKDAFLVRTSTNHWVAWDGTPDDTEGAGEIPNNVHFIINADESTKIQATKSAFAATTALGVLTWGDDTCGGHIDNEAETVLLSMNSPEVYATKCSFVATDSSTGKLAIWGDSQFTDVSSKTVGKFSVLTSNHGVLITDSVNGQVHWSLGTAKLSKEAENLFNISVPNQTISSSDAYATVNRLGSNYMLTSWASADTALDVTLACNNPIDLYSTQSPIDYASGYFLAYHPNCGESDLTIWGDFSTGGGGDLPYVCDGLINGTSRHNADNSCIKVNSVPDSNTLVTATVSESFYTKLAAETSPINGKTLIYDEKEEGKYYRFQNRYNEMAELCTRYNQIELAGRTNWKASHQRHIDENLRDALQGAYGPVGSGSMWERYGWPTGRFYLFGVSPSNYHHHYYVNMDSGEVYEWNSTVDYGEGYSACYSE